MIVDLLTIESANKSPIENHQIAIESVRYSKFPRNDRPGARQPAAPGKIPDERENPDEDCELHGVEQPGLRQDLPDQPEHGLRPTDRPHRSVKVPPLVTLAFCG